MNKLGRLALIAGLGIGVQIANAQAVFTLVDAHYTLNNSGPFNFTFIPNGPAMTVDFIPGAPNFLVGDSTQFTSGVATIIYTVNSVVPISGIDLTFQGDVEFFGEVNWTETAEVGSHNLGSINGSVKGSSYSGGTNGAYTRTAFLAFDQAVTSFKVKKTFTIDIANQTLPSTSIASVSFIEQNLRPVPEPASMIGLAIGATAIFARRRKK